MVKTLAAIFAGLLVAIAIRVAVGHAVYSIRMDAKRELLDDLRRCGTIDNAKCLKSEAIKIYPALK